MPAISALAGLPIISSLATAPHLPSASLSAYSRLGSAAMTVASTRAAPLPSTSAPLPSATAGEFPGPTVLNLPPLAPTPPGAGVYIGKGQPPVPSKLAEKIRRWEYVEMSELLPEFWSRQEEGENKQVAARRRRQVTEIFTWVQCFCTYASVLSGSSPEAVPELLAYLVTITRVSQDYVGLAWVRYESSFCRLAAVTGDRRWSLVNPSLYSVCFTGRTQHSTRCDLCFSLTHTTKECALMADPDSELPTRVKAVEAALVSLVSQRPSEKAGTGPSQQPCRLWNNNRCCFPRCRYRHVCSGCGEFHPVVSCPQGMRKVTDTCPAAWRKDLPRPY